MTSSINNADLLTPYIQQSKEATAATKKQMADNVATGSSDAATKLSGNLSTFLKILTTQLSHQDPTAPLDTNQFTQELVQFSGVEQQLNTNSLLQKLVNGQSSGNLAANLNYIGNYVEAPSSNNQIVLQGGQSEFGYTLASAASKVKIDVLDTSGKTVASFEGPGATGANYAAWDGKTTSGTQLDDGAYTFKISATDSNGKAITVSNPLTIAKVTALKTASDGTVELLCDGIAVKNGDVDAVYQPSALPEATPLTTASS